MENLSQRNPFCKDDFFDDVLVADEIRPRILEGNYPVQCILVKRIPYCGTWKLHLRFRILEGDDSGLELDLYMNMTDSKGRKFKKVPRASNYYKNWVIANYGHPPSRNDKMSPRIFKDGIFRAIVRDAVPQFPDGTDMPESIHYSVISHLIKREA